MHPRILLLAVFLIGLSGGKGFGQYTTHYYLQKSVFESMPDTEEGEVIFLGNSITAGGHWSELFNDLKVKNRGISGDVTGGILLRLDEVTNRKPAKIFLLIGINDLAKGIPIDTICGNMALIIQRVKQSSPGTDLFIQSVLPVNDSIGNQFHGHKKKAEDVTIVNTRLEEMATENGFVYVDLNTAFSDSDGKLNALYTNDGLHINGAGYQHWKSLVEKYVYE
jgi:hexosaminidase